MNNLTVSLCVVAFNEEKHISNLLDDLADQTYPKERTEIVLVDGLSTDRTKEIMIKFQDKQLGKIDVKIVDNPKRIQAAGWNKAIQTSTGDVVIRIDAHSHITPEFAENNMRLQGEGEFVTGGLRQCLIEDPSPWRNMLLEIENSLFGSSINKSRRSLKKNYVKTMFHAAYRREVFDRVGLLNENLLRTEDNELHYRIRSAGYQLCYDPNIISFQYARNSLKGMVKQKYANGYWIGITLGFNYKILSIYHVIPLIFLFGVVLTTFLLIFGYGLPATLMWSGYGLLLAVEMIKALIRRNVTGLVIFFPFLFLSLHLAYGFGTLIGLSKMPSILRKFE